MALITLFYGLYLPKKYAVEVSSAAQEFQVKEDLIFAVIKAESNFHPESVSRSGAVGLMQILPSTAEFINAAMKEKLNLSEPRDNIRLGTWYLSYLQSKFKTLDEVLAAYNAGEGTVRNWMKDERYVDQDGALKNIPYAETRAYVSRVKKFMLSYKLFYF